MNELLLRRRLASGSLPYDAEVEYIFGTGSQYIDTGIVCGSNSKVEIKLKNNLNGVVGVFGCRDYVYSLSNAFCFYSLFLTKMQTSYDNTKANKEYEKNVPHVFTLDKNESYIDGTLVDTFNSNTFTCSSSALLFASRTGSGGATVDNRMFCGRIYYCKIWNNDVLVRDYIPVRVGQVGYMYDRVSRQLFGNAGTGSFRISDDVSYDSEIEYLEGNGTQYADTKIRGDNNSSVELKMTASQNAVSGCFGSRIYTNAISRAFYIYRLSSNNVQFGYGNTSYNATFSQTSNPHIFKFDKNVASIDGATVHTFNAQTFTTQSVFLLFSSRTGTYGGEADSRMLSGKVYYCKIWDNSNLVGDFIPVRLGVNGYFYDNVTGELFGNSGTGNFILGPDI